MCGIVGLHLRDSSLYPQLGTLLTEMIGHMVDRGPDSAGMAIYGDPIFSPAGQSTVSLLDPEIPAEQLAQLASETLGVEVTGHDLFPTAVLHSTTSADTLAVVVKQHDPSAHIIGLGNELAVLKGVGNPTELAHGFRLHHAQGWQGVAHTRMATESAVTATGSHPFSVGMDQCLVHNGSFSNHMSIRHQLEREGIAFDSENDTEVGARFIAKHLAEGADLEKALLLLNEHFDGFYTLVVSTNDSFAVVRDAISCKPAVIAETDAWVAMASEYRALAHLPDVESANMFEPEPEEVYVWHRHSIPQISK